MTNSEYTRLKELAALIETLFKELDEAKADIKVLNAVNATLVKENNILADTLTRFCKNAFVK